MRAAKGDRVRAFDPWFGKEIDGTVTQIVTVEELDGATRLFVWTGARHVWIAPENVREVRRKRK